MYGDFRGFPSAILTSGTRDLFLSNTVRVHRKLRQAGVEAALQVFEGQSHAQYYADPFGPKDADALASHAFSTSMWIAKSRGSLGPPLCTTPVTAL